MSDTLPVLPFGTVSNNNILGETQNFLCSVFGVALIEYRFCGSRKPVPECKDLKTHLSPCKRGKCNILQMSMRTKVAVNCDGRTEVSLWMFKFITQSHCRLLAWHVHNSVSGALKLLKTSEIITELCLAKPMTWHGGNASVPVFFKNFVSLYVPHLLNHACN